VSGPIIVEHQVDLTAQRDGILSKIFFDAPARVKAGTILARLDDRQIAANLEATRAKSRSIEADLRNWEAEAEVLKADYVRQQRLWDLGLTTQEQLEHAKYKAESDQWDIKRVKETLNTSREEERALELELEKTKVTAPFDGLIARRYVREGQTVAKNDRCFRVSQLSPLLVLFQIPEASTPPPKLGNTVEVFLLDNSQQPFSARITKISPTIDPASDSYNVTAQLSASKIAGLRPGMAVRVTWENRPASSAHR